MATNGSEILNCHFLERIIVPSLSKGGGITEQEADDDDDEDKSYLLIGVICGVFFILVIASVSIAVHITSKRIRKNDK